MRQPWGGETSDAAVAAAAAIDLGLDTTFIRNCAADGPRHHEVLIGVGANDRGQTARIGGVLAAVVQPHRLVSDALRSLARGSTTEVTALPTAPSCSASC